MERKTRRMTGRCILSDAILCDYIDKAWN